SPLFSSRLPDMDSLIGRQVQLVARLYVERLVPGVDIADDAVHPIFRRAVRVAEQALAKRAFADPGAPALAVGQEEPPVAGPAVDHRRLAMLGEVAAIGGIGHFDAAQIADILAHGELAVDLRARDRLVCVILLAEDRGAGVELLGRLRRPPV